MWKFTIKIRSRLAHVHFFTNACDLSCVNMFSNLKLFDRFPSWSAQLVDVVLSSVFVLLLETILDPSFILLSLCDNVRYLFTLFCIYYIRICSIFWRESVQFQHSISEYIFFSFTIVTISIFSYTTCHCACMYVLELC
jgi:hypothetical protein